MDSDSYAALLRAISGNEINRVLAEGGFTHWCYFVDDAAAVVGILVANSGSLAMYHLANGNSLKLSPLGVMPLAQLSYVPDEERFRPVANKQTVEIYLLNDLNLVTEQGMSPNFDFGIAKQWQGFLAASGVPTIAL